MRPHPDVPLMAGEVVLWSGQPDRRRWFARSDLITAAFLVAFSAFFAFWEHGVWTARTISGGQRYDWPFRAWGIAIYVLAWVISIGQFVLRQRRKRDTTYVLTSWRALVLGGASTFELASRSPRQVWWSRNRTHVTVLWAIASSATPFGRYSPLRQSKRSVFFADVADGEALVAALGSL